MAINKSERALGDLVPEGGRIPEQIRETVTRIDGRVAEMEAHLPETLDDQELWLHLQTGLRIIEGARKIDARRPEVEELGYGKFIDQEAGRARNGFQGYREKYPATPEGAGQCRLDTKIDLAAAHYYFSGDNRDRIDALVHNAETIRRQREDERLSLEPVEGDPEHAYDQGRFETVERELGPDCEKLAKYVDENFPMEQKREFARHRESGGYRWWEPWYRAVAVHSRPQGTPEAVALDRADRYLAGHLEYEKFLGSQPQAA